MLLLAGCAGQSHPAPAASPPPADSATPAATAPAATATPDAAPSAGAAAPTLSPERAAYFRGGLPEAVAFARRSIPPELVPPADKGNDCYYEARDATGSVVGYLRDFTGPVSPADECACNPLNLTLVFNKDQTLRTLLAPAPLQKLYHVAMSPAEQEQLISLLKAPPPALMGVRRVEDVVDATTGATRLELANVVVPQAGLSTRRIAGLVHDSQRILQGAPAGRDRVRLQDILAKASKGRDLSQALASFLPTAESPELRQHAYRVMAAAYADALRNEGQAADDAVEATLLRPDLAPDVEATEILNACYHLITKGLRLPLAARCLTRLQEPTAGTLPTEHLALLRGTARFLSGDVGPALQDLQAAAIAIPLERDPELHMRLARALAVQGKAPEACRVARGVFRTHPLLRGAKEGLAPCVGPRQDVQAVADALVEENRLTLLSTQRHATPPVPSIAVETVDGQPIDLPLSEPGKVTVAVFFATWCPHCRSELPRIKEFVSSMESRPELQGRFRVVGIRTAVERETEPYADFAAQFALNFPIWTDATMSMAFARFAKAESLTTSLPTTAVIDNKGNVRFLLEPGDHRDTKSELTWAVEAAAQAAPKTTAPHAGKKSKKGSS